MNGTGCTINLAPEAVTHVLSWTSSLPSEHRAS
jgi:hypothetical protein